MAKENFVQIVGPIKGDVSYNEDETMARWTQIAMRRNGKTDFVPLIGYDEVAKKLKEVGRPGQWLISKGMLSTRQVLKRVTCPYCGRVHDVTGQVTEVLVIDLASFDAGDKTLEDFKEMSNVVFLLGSVCSPTIQSDETENGVPRTRYQVAVNRKYNAKRQPDLRTDYPFIVSFARQAEEDQAHLQTGSQCFISGGLQVCNVVRPITCECRDEEGHRRQFGMNDVAVDVVTNSVEYLNNCKF